MGGPVSGRLAEVCGRVDCRRPGGRGLVLHPHADAAVLLLSTVIMATLVVPSRAAGALQCVNAVERWRRCAGASWSLNMGAGGGWVRVVRRCGAALLCY